MTREEKFKEDWGFEPNVTHCPKCGRESCMVCPYAEKRFEECASDWWHSEYQGEPTIPLSVIEDIKSVLELLSDDADRACKASNSYSVRDRLRTKAQAYDDVAKMIDGKIKEIKHD